MTRRSTTRGTVEWLRNCTVVMAATAAATTVLAFLGVANTASTVRDRTTQAIVEVASARAALVQADQAAIASFRSGEVTLSGPGQGFVYQMTTASQNLARVAELNQAATGTGILQVVEGLVASYSGAVEQADADYRQPGGRMLGTADLADASKMLHGTGGVLDELSRLQQQERAALEAEIAEDGMSPGALVTWLVPLVALLLLLVGTQLFLGVRFRRVLNLPLAGATVLAAAVVVALLHTFVLHQHLADVRGKVDTAMATWQTEIKAADAQGTRGLTELVRRCESDADCGPALSPDPAPQQDTKPKQVTERVREVAAATEAAAGFGWLVFAIPAALVLAAVLTLAGLQPRITEYRYAT